MTIDSEKRPSAGGPIPASDPESQKNVASTRLNDEDVGSCDDPAAAPDVHHALHRSLKSRHVAMIAIGGSIGTGLVIGTGSVLQRSGPGSLLIAYAAVGMLCYLVMTALGEMATWLPIPSAFTGYAHRFVDPALGFALGWNYWFKYIIGTPNNLTGAALILQYWVDREKVNPGAWIAIFLVVIILINYFGVAYFGETEFILCSMKVLVILGIMLLSIILAAGGGPNHHATGFQYWNNPGAFKPYILTGSAGKFLAFWNALTTAVFAFLGTELVGVTVGECANPRRAIPRAIRLTFYRILFFYVGSVFLLGLIIPYNSKALASATSASTSATASPFVAAIVTNGIQTLPGIVNGCLLIFVLSAANSDLYTSTRTLYSLALEGSAPRIFAWTNSSGVPVYALGLSSLTALIGFLNVSTGSATVFTYFVNLVTIFGLLTWISISVTHICFIRARKAQDISNSALAYVAPFGQWGSFGALCFSILISIFKGFNYFVHNPKTYGDFDYKDFITAYLGIPLFLIMIIGYKLIKKSIRVLPEKADLYSGKAMIDQAEAEYLEERAKRHGHVEGKYQKLYRLTVGTMF